MKKLLFPLAISSALLAQTFAGSFGPGPWASGAYYPGGTDGKYQASVTGNNITGVIGFSIREGSPGTLSTDTQNNQTTDAADASASTIQAATTASTVFDQTQNYFVIFVEGRTYTGLAVASVNVLANSVVGSLLGAQPAFGYQSNNFTDITIFAGGSSNAVVTTNPAVTNLIVSNSVVISNESGIITASNIITTTNVVIIAPERVTNFVANDPKLPTAAFDPLPVINRGVSGGFQAQLQNKGSYMSFAGTGELSSPSQKQTVDLSTNNGQLVGEIVTETVPFLVNGLRTSFSTSLTVSSTTTGN
jgi:hypothetical protein